MARPEQRDAANPGPADTARVTIEGQQAAASVLRDLQSTCPHPDLLRDRLLAILLMQEPERLRAWCREVQKRLERSV